MTIRNTLVALIAALLVSCAATEEPKSDPWQKVEMDLTQIDEDGLRGPPDGKVAVAYEFAVPDTEECRVQVKAIDSTVKLMRGSRGRVGAGKDECLCVGSTHQRNWRDVLRQLAELSYVDRIIECHFE